MSNASDNAAEPRFVRYNASSNWGHVYFRDEKLGNAERLADGLYVPQGARNARTLYQSAMTLAENRVSRAEKELKVAQRLASAIAALRIEGTEKTPRDSTDAPLGHLDTAK